MTSAAQAIVYIPFASFFGSDGVVGGAPGTGEGVVGEFGGGTMVVGGCSAGVGGAGDGAVGGTAAGSVVPGVTGAFAGGEGGAGVEPAGVGWLDPCWTAPPALVGVDS